MSPLTDLTHHAALFVHPERKMFAERLWKELHALSIAHVFYNQTVLDIKTARDIITWASTPYNEEKIALITFHSISLPAQNALLKIIEEPRLGVRFILVTGNREALIDTLYSRLQHVNRDQVTLTHKDTSKDAPLDNALLFLTTSASSRMKLPFITTLLTATDEEDRKDREGVTVFILSCALVLKKYPNNASATLETLDMASYASDSSTSGKALIEYLSLLLPQLKI